MKSGQHLLIEYQGDVSQSMHFYSIYCVIFLELKLEFPSKVPIMEEAQDGKQGPGCKPPEWKSGSGFS